jgi:hypothetical protein
MRSGIISVNQNSWHTCQATIKRTELFHESGLFSFSDHFDDVIKHPKCTSMIEHRNFKANELLKIRSDRNADRAATRNKLVALKTNPVQVVETELVKRINNLHQHRMNVAVRNGLTVD